MNKTFSLMAGTAILVSATLGLTACGGSAANAESAADKTKYQAAVSIDDFGGMEGLEKAAKAEGQLNLIALPHDWSNWGGVIEAFKKKYPEITVNEQNPNASSKEEIDAIKTNAGTDKAPDTVDVGLAVAVDSTQYFAAYETQGAAQIDPKLKNKDKFFTPDYTGVMSLGWNKTKYGDVKSIEDLKDSKFAGVVSLNGKPAEAGAAFNGFIMANLANGGDLQNLQPGLDFFKELKSIGNLNTIDVTSATIDSGQTAAVFDWSYNQISTRDRLKGQGVDWSVIVFPGTEVGSYYQQAINKEAPHPAAARLWQEFLYTPEAQNLWMKGGAMPVLMEQMEKDGTIDAEAKATLIETSQPPLTYSPDDSARITTWLQQNWDKAIGN
ncbi:ABC transporter substrate-binding protein [Mobiluncus massiliensis]|uniref:ABC transporter substrate-binding protein n=1 Tax=uncultured Mobiluncus sp. TaxID=293425 RepID=UPI0024ADE88C|nr:extracellular solute-binding protein [Mobiluncus sp. Marseille-Q7826]